MIAIGRAAAGTALAVGLGIGAVLSAPAASADEKSYIADIEDYGFTGSVDKALTFGYAACQLSDNGYAIGDIAEGVYQNTGSTVSRDDASYLVEAALIYLC